MDSIADPGLLLHFGEIMKTLTGNTLAKEYAKNHPLSKKNPGKVHGCYDGGGWITIHGNNLEPHPDLKAQ